MITDVETRKLIEDLGLLPMVCPKCPSNLKIEQCDNCSYSCASIARVCDAYRAECAADWCRWRDSIIDDIVLEQYLLDMDRFLYFSDKRHRGRKDKEDLDWPVLLDF